MKVNIKRLRDDIELPRYETTGAVGFDLMAAEDVTINPKEIAMISTGLVIEVPAGYMLVIASRSSTPGKKGLTPPHGLGIIDQDYCGPSDEIKVMVYNFTEQSAQITKGEKIAQGVFVRTDRFEWQESTSDFKTESRGGFGSTGGYNNSTTHE